MNTLIVRDLGIQDYQPVWQAMRDFTDQRDDNSPDELWLLQHNPVFTQGQAGKAEHVLAAGDIPIVQSDRGGQVTYHGPGQLIGYLLVDLKRRKLGVRDLVTHIEKAIVSLLQQYGVSAKPRADAPGVYVDNGAKIAQLGLRVRKGCSFHGLSLNVAMALEPFQRINPCGYAGMAVTCLRDELGREPEMPAIYDQLVSEIMAELGYNGRQLCTDRPAGLSI
jgi:lipoyl(octanoyl) transferase